MTAARVAAIVAVAVAISSSAFAQDDPHAGMQMDMSAAPHGWSFMHTAVVFVMVNDQGSPRGATEVRAPNWWMGMATHPVRRGTFTVRLMLSGDPATIGSHGYAELFQVGETYHGAPLVDRQHPHDLLMQASAVWHQPIGAGAGLTLAAAPVGEPALGPVAFMHRASAYENPMAPLGHHTLDSTHIAMGVVTAGLDRGPFAIEGSIFRGAEPDENRWDLMDPGRLDSWSGRAWFRPSAAWAFQLSHGFLKKPEALEPGDVRRTTASVSWRHERSSGWSAATLAWGHNAKISGRYNAWLGELTDVRGATTIFTRVESVNVDDDELGNGRLIGADRPRLFASGGGIDRVAAVTVGATRTIWRPRRWDVAAGGEITGYGVPSALTPSYGAHPASLQIFARVRPPGHRMLDMTMTSRD